jgi:hypothetical protein
MILTRSPLTLEMGLLLTRKDYSMQAPLIVFGYKRKEHIKNTLKALNNNYLAGSTKLYIFLDGARNVDEQADVEAVQNYVSNFSTNCNFQEVIIKKSEQNIGLANSIINGVSSIIEKYDKVIVVEDDLITTRNFLQFMNDALDFYQHDNKIGMIEGYSLPLKSLKLYTHDIYLSKRGGSWGWATWKDRWNKAEWELENYKKHLASKKLQKKLAQGGTDLPYMLNLQANGKLNSWAIRWCLTMSLHNWLTICPKYSMVQNCGMDNSGENCSETHDYDVEIEEKPYKLEFVEIDKRIIKEIYQKMDVRYFARIIKSIKFRFNLL